MLRLTEVCKKNANYNKNDHTHPMSTDYQGGSCRLLLGGGLLVLGRRGRTGEALLETLPLSGQVTNKHALRFSRLQGNQGFVVGGYLGACLRESLERSIRRHVKMFIGFPGGGGNLEPLTGRGERCLERTCSREYYKAVSQDSICTATWRDLKAEC